MRILLTCHVRFASAMAWYTFHLARGLQAQGHSVWLSAQRGSPLASWAATERIPGDYSRDFHSANPLELWRSLSSIRKAIGNFKPDILNPHCPPGHALVAFANGRRLPLIRTVAEPRPPKRQAINRILHERWTDGIIFSTASSLPRYANAFNLQYTAQRVVLPGLDLALFPKTSPAAYRRELQVPDNALFGAIVARMNPEKGQEVLIEALTLLPEVYRRQIVVLLTGDDNRQRTSADLQRLAESKGVASSLRFMNRLPDIRPLLAEIDLGIITSTRSEAVCRVALEYMAYSKPIISTDVNILSEVVRRGENGWCVPVSNPRMMADALVAAIGDRDSLSAMGERGRQMLESEFSLEKMTADTLSFYQEVIVSRGRR